MTMRYWTRVQGVLLFGFLAMFICTCQTHAGLVYSLRFDQDTYQIDRGSTLEVKLILRELATENDVNRIGYYDSDNDRTYGLMGGNFKVNWNGTVQLVAKKGDAKPGPGFTPLGGTPTLSNNQVLVRESADFFGDGVTGYNVEGQPGLREVLLGTLKFTIPTDFSMDTTLVTLDQESTTLHKDFSIKTGPSSFAYIDGSLLSGTATLNLVPEPSSMALLGLAMAIGGGCWWRRRRSVAGAN